MVSGNSISASPNSPAKTKSSGAPANGKARRAASSQFESDQGGLHTWLPIPYRRTIDYAGIITLEPGKRGGKPCIRGLRITVYDVLEYLAGGMSHADVLAEFPYLVEEDILACLAFAADRERRVELLSV